MSLWLACKAFCKALGDPAAAAVFLADAQVEKKTDSSEGDLSHLRLLAALQRTGRFIDFLQEDIDDFDDAQVGAAVREVHRSCRQCLDDLVAIKPVLEELEGAEVRLPKGYDAARIKIVGNVVGEPPYTAYVVHRGWQARKQSLPRSSGGASGGPIVAPAEVEVR
jgi:hypothetical protein